VHPIIIACYLPSTHKTTILFFHTSAILADEYVRPGHITSVPVLSID
jgi:hypothetical protein